MIWSLPMLDIEADGPFTGDDERCLLEISLIFFLVGHCNFSGLDALAKSSPTISAHEISN